MKFVGKQIAKLIIDLVNKIKNINYISKHLTFLYKLTNIS